MREFQGNIFSDGELVAVKALICFHLLIALSLVVSSHNLTQGLFDQAICCDQWNSSKCIISIAMKTRMLCTYTVGALELLQPVWAS